MPFNHKTKYPIVIVLIIIGYFSLYILSNLTNPPTLCIFKNITGMPCPACGTIRATIYLLKGDIIKSIITNPLGILVLIISFVTPIWIFSDSYLKRETFWNFLHKKRSNYLILIAIIITLLNWFWNIKKGL